MSGYQNTEREVVVLQEAKSEARTLRLLTQLDRLKEALSKRRPIKGFKKIQPKSANTYEARLNRQYRAYLIFDGDTPIILKVGDHL